MNRTPREVRNKSERDIILLTWDSRLEEDITSRLREPIFTDKGVQAWDLQRHPYFAEHFRSNAKPSAEKACDALGIITEHNGNSISHCAANDAVFTLAKFIALGTLTNEQYHTFCVARQPLRPMMHPGFVGFTINAVNAPKAPNARPKPPAAAAAPLPAARPNLPRVAQAEAPIADVVTSTAKQMTNLSLTEQTAVEDDERVVTHIFTLPSGTDDDFQWVPARFRVIDGSNVKRVCISADDLVEDQRLMALFLAWARGQPAV
ncbi:hypothetical protein B0I35DRAFT_248809 [Stachybotrys elegans]|uniref:Uncharacterized protein n=1 Tax=Stachybotrys elegans TaxID=80388 RepID=A0A8K0SV65_9HYPO|nr:hypothetical protein B0I35DRAFT_248809 [Stachybotrys elegans]